MTGQQGAALAGIRRLLSRIARARRRFIATATTRTVRDFWRAIGITDGGALRLDPLPRQIKQLELRALATLHTHRAVSPESGRARFRRALHLLITRCMALFTRSLALSNPAATRRSAPEV
ncbi:hypothetical protein [Kitasatospora sp. NPDC096204]|uniref:hypothetical protein n=1 Tax=Kitasatospora sp. NPDC096204 TaxID=3364094 RepID=UPI0037F36F3C